MRFTVFFLILHGPYLTASICVAVDTIIPVNSILLMHDYHTIKV